MWEKRKYLYLLRRFRDSRKKYLGPRAYGYAIRGGVDIRDFIRFSYINWGTWHTILLFLHIKRIPSEIREIKENEVKHKTEDFNKKIISLKEICQKNEFIKVTEDSSGDKIILLYEGEQFIKFAPFYIALWKVYNPLWLLLFGVLGTLTATNVPKIIDSMSSLFLFLGI